MIGANLPHHILTAEDARAFAAAIAALRAEIECIEAVHKPELDYIKEQADAIRAERDAATGPMAQRAAELRKVLADWLAGDPDGSLKDGDRIVATLSRKSAKPQIHADQLPPEWLTPQPDVPRIMAALACGERIPGVVVKVETSLRVL